MNSDLVFFINGIKEKTGIDVYCYDEKGKHIYGDKKEDILVPKELDVFSDKDNNRTIFWVKIKSKKYICANFEKNVKYLLFFACIFFIYMLL